MVLLDYKLSFEKCFLNGVPYPLLNISKEGLVRDMHSK